MKAERYIFIYTITDNFFGYRELYRNSVKPQFSIKAQKVEMRMSFYLNNFQLDGKAIIYHQNKSSDINFVRQDTRCPVVFTASAQVLILSVVMEDSGKQNYGSFTKRLSVI